MNRQLLIRAIRSLWPVLLLAAWPGASHAQVAVPDIEEIDELPVISAAEIEELVGPIALYPDDLLAIVLPASTYPLQIVEAGRFLEGLEDEPSLEPDPEWDDSIVALLNYPEVVEMLNEDLDWTWRLGEAVVGQQSDVIGAIEEFRDRAYAAGNLQTDDYQLVAEEEGAISITPVQEDVIYVPYYEPEEVVVYQPRRVYYYYPRAYPVYYYPYPSWYTFHDRFYHSWFWGVTTAFSIGWHSHNLSVYHHSFYGHPYYGRAYLDRWWYRRPDIHVYNNVYVRNNHYTNVNRYRDGDRWSPRNRRTVNSDRQITRTRTYTNSRSTQVARSTTSHRLEGSSTWRSEREPIEFRKRPSSGSVATSRTTRSATTPTRDSQSRNSTLRPSLQRDSRDTSVRVAQQPRVTTTQPSRSKASSGSTSRQRSTRPASPSREPVSRPGSSSRQSALKPSSSARQAAPRQSSSRQSASRPSSSRQQASRPSSSSKKSTSAAGRSSRSDGSNKKADKK